MFTRITATPAEVAAPHPGDDIVGGADVVIDRAFTLDAPPDAVWPWIVQLGKRRAGWYLPRPAERFLPRSHRALRAIDPAWQDLTIGAVIPDYGGSDATFEVAQVDPPTTLVYRSRRGRTNLSWSIMLTAVAAPGSVEGHHTRIHFRLRLGPVRRRRLAETVGGLFDALTIAGLAAGLRERLGAASNSPQIT